MKLNPEAEELEQAEPKPGTQQAAEQRKARAQKRVTTLCRPNAGQELPPWQRLGDESAGHC